MPAIHVTKPALAPLDAFARKLESAWESGVLTHNGPLVRELEARLCDYLALPRLAAVTNGTIALQLAIRALGLRGEIITTPFSWVATASAIVYEGCRPVFVDIDPETLNIDPAQIEARITRHTSAILPVHVFSNPCATGEIGEIAARHRLKVIYDGAHAFNVRQGGQPLALAGDVTALSFHATKLFNTGEGGACVSADPELDARIRRLRFFGHDDARNIVDDGTNGKMTEIHAALGLVNLEFAAAVERKRRSDYAHYQACLGSAPALRFQRIDPEACNHSYLPVIFPDEDSLLATEQALLAESVVARRYFYPALNTLDHLFPYQPFPVAESISRRILCLPLYFELGTADIERISGIVVDSLARHSSAKRATP